MEKKTPAFFPLLRVTPPPSLVWFCPSPPFPPLPYACRRRDRLNNSKMDKLSKSDPFVVVKWKTDSDETWREIGEMS